MSLQWGIGDIVLISRLAWQVYQTFKYAPKELEVLEKQVLSIANLLDQIAVTFEALYLNRSQRRALRQLVTQCEEALKEVETITKRYASINSEKAKWKILRYHIESGNIQQVRQQLMDQVALLSNFNSTIAIWSLAGIKKKLDTLVKTAPDDSVISDHDVRTLQEDDASWSRLHQELEDIGIASEVIARNRRYFVAWIAAAISENDTPDKKLDQLWNSPIEGETQQQCVICGRNDHDAEACPQMEVFDTKRVPAAPLVMPEEHDKVGITLSPSFNSYSQRAATLSGSTSSARRRKISLSGFGMDTNISAGPGPGSGPQLPVYRPRPSSVSTGSSSSRASRKFSHDSSDTNDGAVPERPRGLRTRFTNKLSTFGSSSPLEQGF